MADGDFVIVHGRYSGLTQPVNWIEYAFSTSFHTNATVVDYAVRLVSSNSKEKLKSSNNGSEDRKGSREAYYGDDKGQLE